MARARSAEKSLKSGTTSRRCGLCGKAGNLVKTECCANWICDDAHKYVMFSFARNSCYRNHSRYTLCAYHHTEGHAGDWKTCKKCRSEFDTEMYVWYATNEHNFEKLENPPSFKPTRCANCGAVISLANDGYSVSGREYWCESCTEKNMEKNFPNSSSGRRGKSAPPRAGLAYNEPQTQAGDGKVIFEEAYGDILQTIETAIVGVHKRQPSLLDFDVLDALEGLIRRYGWENEGRGTPSSRLSDRAQQVFDDCQKVCEWRLGRGPKNPEKRQQMRLSDTNAITIAELIPCLKRIRSSVRFWNKEGGRQGYLNYVRGFIDGD